MAIQETGRPPRQAEVDLGEARKALFVMVGFIAVIWVIQIANWGDHYGLDASYGLLPRDVARLPDIFTAPLLHASWAHIESNSGPLFIFGFLAAYRGVVKFLGLTVLVAVTSGVAVWFFQGGNAPTVGASGLIFGYFGYVICRGLIDRNLIDALIGLVMALSFAYLVTEAIPGAPAQVSWLGHLGGLIGGLAGGFLLRSRRAAPRETRQASGTQLPVKARQQAAGKAGFQASSGHPRADLHAELDEMGL